MLSILFSLFFIVSPTGAPSGDVINCDHPLILVDYIDDGECTVTMSFTLDAGGDWKVAAIGAEGSISMTSTQSTCAEAVKDIQGGLAALF